MTTFTVNDQQHATIIAALNFYYTHGQGDPANRSDEIHDLATNGDTVISLDNHGIDQLIMYLNNGEREWLEAFKKEFNEKLAAMSDEELVESFRKIGCEVELLEYSEEDDDSVCRECGEPNDDGEGYDGLCGNCADMATCKDCGEHLGDPVEDPDDRLCDACQSSTCGTDGDMESTSGGEVDIRQQCWENAAKDDPATRAEDDAFIARVVAATTTPPPEIGNDQDIPT
jgi:hypothetical protein